MFRKILFIVIVSFFVLGISRLSLAQAEHPHSQTPAASKNSVDVGNKICPVSGEKIDDKTKATYEYKGKIYNFCCPDCIVEFKKDPDKYIKKIEEEKAKEEKTEGESMPEHSTHEEHPRR